MSKRFSWILFSGSLLFASGALTAACGGTAELGPGQAGASGQGGSSNGGASNGGSAGGPACPHSCPALACLNGYKRSQGPGDCCPVCVPDGSGGTGGNCDLGCPDIGCGPGYRPVQSPGQCCPSCVPDGSGGFGGGNTCNNVNCPLIACGNGYEFVIPAGECCGQCVPGDKDQACLDGQSEYQSLRSSLLGASSTASCAKDGDCKVLGANPSCGEQCAGTVVNVQSAKSIEAQLSRFAAENCASCPFEIAPCAPLPPPFCSGGQCQLYHAL